MKTLVTGLSALTAWLALLAAPTPAAAQGPNAIQPSAPPATLCCPPLTAAQLKSMLSYLGSGAINAPYQLVFTPTTQLNNQMIGYRLLLDATIPPVVSVAIHFDVYDGGTGAVATPGGPSLGNLTWHWAAAPGLATSSQMSAVLATDRWYRVRARYYRWSGVSFATLPCPDLLVDLRLQVM